MAPLIDPRLLPEFPRARICDEHGGTLRQRALCARTSTTESSSAAPPSLVPGMRLDRYELICPIGKGGMGQVWVARQIGKYGFQKLVAIKTMLPRFALEERSHAMFVDEVRLASRVEHPNVAQILDVGEQADTTYLVMEYVEGEALSVIRDMLRRKHMCIPSGILLRIASDVCAGLQVAHDLPDGEGELLGVVHRDVSPQNIIVSTNGEAKLIDFGLAKARGRVSGDTSEGTLKGKIRFMAPEQACGRAVDRRTDVWSIGAVLHDALSGTPLYRGENETQILHAMMCSEPVVSLPPSVDPAIAAVVRRALMPAPEDRFATAAEMQQAIESAMAEAKLTVTSQDVASFLVDQVGPRMMARRQLLRRGLDQAALRAQQLQRPEEEGASDRFAESAPSSRLDPEKESDYRRPPGHLRHTALAVLGTALLAAGLGLMSQPSASSSNARPSLSKSAEDLPAKRRTLVPRTPGLCSSPYLAPGARAEPSGSAGAAADGSQTGSLSPLGSAWRRPAASSRRRVEPKAPIDYGF